MKHLTLIILIAFAAFSCSKNDETTGSVEVKVSYYYNAYQGYKPDANAKAYLFKGSNVVANKYVKSRLGIAYIGETEVESNFRSVADVNGTVLFENIPSGNYLLVVVSEGRSSYSAKQIEVGSGKLSLIKNFGYLHEWDDLGESW